MKWSMTSEELNEVLRTLDDPSRDVDDRIWRWVNNAKLNPAAPGWEYDLHPAPLFTESLDAARSLIPRLENADGVRPMDYVLEHVNGGLTIGARVGEQDPNAAVFGGNDAIALSRAAICAHVMLGQDGLRSRPLSTIPLP